MTSPGTQHAPVLLRCCEPLRVTIFLIFTHTAKTAAVLKACMRNVRSIVDSEGAIKVASQGYND